MLFAKIGKAEGFSDTLMLTKNQQKKIVMIEQKLVFFFLPDKPFVGKFNFFLSFSRKIKLPYSDILEDCHCSVGDMATGDFVEPKSRCSGVFALGLSANTQHLDFPDIH